jgi:uncharacterized membrane protein HdeD (DUF308 family)
MGIIAQNKISSLGMLFGAIALIMGIIHFSALFPHHRQRLKASWRTKRLKLKEVFSPE